jgi:hypothetical protein
MTGALLKVAAIAALALAVALLVLPLFGPVAMLLVLALGGIVLARPLIDLATEFHHGTRAAAWRAVEGRHFAYRGVPLQVLEDADHQRWIRAADVRAVLGHTASDGTLALTYPSGWKLIGGQPHFSDEALLLHLAREPSPAASKMRLWAEREIAFPARRLREQAGVKPPRPQAPSDD